MKIWTSEYTFNSPWEKTCHAAMNKYPNPFNPAVEAIDVLQRKVDDQGVLHSRRLLSTSWGIPGWARKIMGFSEAVWIDETSQVDQRNRVFKLQVRWRAGELFGKMRRGGCSGR